MAGCRIKKGWAGDYDEALGYPILIDGTWGSEEDYIPHYSQNLNMIHELLNQHVDGLDQTFYHALENVIFRDRRLSSPDDSFRDGFSGWIAHATARQLCEAFLTFIKKDFYENEDFSNE